MAKKKALPKIKYYYDDNGKTIAVTSYAKKTIRAVAKCHPDDVYNKEVGEQIAKDKLMEKFWVEKVRRLLGVVLQYDEIIMDLRLRQRKVEEALGDTLEAYKEYFGKPFFDEDEDILEELNGDKE